MEKSKVWIKDRLSISDYQIGQKVNVARRKRNGYPISMIDGESYLIKEIKDDFLILRDHRFNFTSEIKVHWTYCLNLQLMRDETIKDLLKN